METLVRPMNSPGIIMKSILGSTVPVVPVIADNRYYEMFHRIGVLLNVFVIDNPDMFMVHIEAIDMRNGDIYGYTGDNISYGMDKINEDIKQRRS